MQGALRDRSLRKRSGRGEQGRLGSRAMSRAPGLAEKILPLDQIGNEIIRRVAAQPSLQLTHWS